jgi:hypothetical protein
MHSKGLRKAANEFAALFQRLMIEKIEKNLNDLKKLSRRKVLRLEF